VALDYGKPKMYRIKGIDIPVLIDFIYYTIFQKRIARMVELRTTVLAKISQSSEEIVDFILHDLAYYSSRGLPLQVEPIILEAVSSLLWESMKLHKSVMSLPISSLSERLVSNQAFAFGKGIPSLYRKHVSFRKLLHTKNPPMMEASFIPLKPLLMVLRRPGLRRLLTLTKSQIVRRLTFAYYTSLTFSAAASLAALVVGPVKVLALVGLILSGLRSLSSSNLGNPGLDSAIDIIERFSIVILFISGIILILKWNTIHTGLTILNEQLVDGMGILDYLKEVISLFHICATDLLSEYGQPVWEMVSSGPPIMSYAVGILGGWIFLKILMWIFGW